MHIGHYISAIAHIGLIGWVMFGGAFRSNPPPMEVTGVSVITTEEFEAVVNAQTAPLPVTDVAAPQLPEPTDETPVVTSEADVVPTRDAPDEAPAPDADAQPDISDLAVPQPSEVGEEAPVLTPPETETAVLVPRDVNRPAPRVAPTPVAPPEPDTKVDDQTRKSVTPDETGETATPPVEETAPEAAGTEIATEANQGQALAPSKSVRPKLRPARSQDRPRPGPEDSVNAALAAAGADVSGTPAAPSGPPLTQGEKDGLRISVQECWVVDVGSRAADVVVTVGFSLDRNGKVSGPVNMLSAEGGDEVAVKTAFEAARRAVLRCQKGGYKLPIDKYDHWRDVEITFNPEKMRRK